MSWHRTLQVAQLFLLHRPALHLNPKKNTVILRASDEDARRTSTSTPPHIFPRWSRQSPRTSLLAADGKTYKEALANVELIIRAGGRALIPKNAFGWPILPGFATVGSFSCPLSTFYFRRADEDRRYR